MDSKQEYDYLFKILLVGDSDTGKTNILLRYSDNTFTTAHLATIGIDFKIKTTHVSNKKVKLQIWDTAGQERFRAITTAYYKGAHGIIIVYNVTDRQSFQHVDNWATQIREFGSEDVTKVLVGNKCDLGERQVSFDEGKALADRLGIEFFETSAKDQLNIEKPFTAVTEKILERFGVYSNEVPSPKKLEDSSTPVGGEIFSLKTGTSFKDLYLDNTFADVIFEVEDEQIYGHKAILAKGCKFFHNLFTSEMKEANSKIIRLEDVKAQSFKVLIAYLYSADKISIDENTALDLVGLADKYLLPDLRKECERVLSGFLNTDNYLKYVSLSEKLGETFLNEAVVKFILKNYESIKDRDDFYDLPKDVMKQVMSGLKAK